MDNHILTEELAAGIRLITRSNGQDPAHAIGEYLERQLQDVSPDGRILILREVAQVFGTGESPDIPRSKSHAATDDKNEVQHRPELPAIGSNRLISMFLGKKTLSSGLSDEELSVRLARSLNVVFDKLNEIIEVINSRLMGVDDGQETIRHLIGSEINDQVTDNSLQSYLDRIREAFLVAHKAFAVTSRKMTGQILAELDPANVEAMLQGKFKFGPMRKAELFDLYSDKFNRCRSAFESGRITEEFMRQFEKVCQETYKPK